jgi:cysteine desulfurase
MNIYLDNASTTAVDKNVLKRMIPFFNEKYGNPSSIHYLGQEALEAVDESKEIISKFLNCRAEEVFFTSSATESNNLAIKGILEGLDFKPHIITSLIEHPSVMEVCKYLEEIGKAEVSYIRPNKEGIVSVEDIKKEIKDNTVLVSIMYANNEIGTIQNISEIGKLIKETNTNRKNGIIFHTDAVQAGAYLNCDVQELGVDLLTLSGHKMYGPKGVSILFIKEGTKIKPVTHGGGQEMGLRSGTYNVPLIVGMGAAVEEIEKNKDRILEMKKLRDYLIDQIEKKIELVSLNGSKEQRLPNNVNFNFKGVEGESIVISLNQEGIMTSSGSACASKKLKASGVLLAIGIKQEDAHGSLRITLGRYTTKKEIDSFLKVLPKIIKRLRTISSFK